MIGKKIFLTTALCISIQFIILAQPAGYYQNAEGKSGTELQQALHDIIDDHTVISYSGLWTAFKTTDDRPDGTVWDMYSDVPDGVNPYDYSFGSDQCGNYSGEGSCYNREHSFPKSWFGDQAPMNSDLFHLYPTDGYVNGKRSNYPFGETNSPSWTSQNGSRVGPCSFTGYTGTVFEPIDEYKGDFARTYFYIATRYFGEDGNWAGSPMTVGAQPESWAKEMLLQWHTNDPVSDKETERNQAVFLIQGNRNPFIDRPEYVSQLFAETIVDQVAPLVDSIAGNDPDTVVVWFNEPLDPVSIINPANFQISSGVEVDNALFLSEDNSVVGLKVSGLKNGSYTLIINGVSDTSGNVLEFSGHPFSVYFVGTPVNGSAVPVIYPNPNKGEFYVKNYHTAAIRPTVRLIDIMGRSIEVTTFTEAELIHIQAVAGKGYYLLIIDQIGGNSLRLPLLIE